MNAPSFQLALLAPRHWPHWLAVGLLRLLCLLPLPWMVRFGEGFGWLAGRLARSRRRVVRINLQLCFPELDAAARERLVNEHFKALGAGLFETGYAWWASDARLRKHGEVVGLEHLDAAQAGGQGVLLLTGHFTTLELGARYLCLAGVKFHAMYRPANSALVSYFMHRWRAARAGLPALPRDDIRALVQALRRGHAIWYAPDQTLNPKISVMAPFFGVPVRTVFATGRLARMGRAKVVPYFPERINGRYRISFAPALESFPSGDDAADTARINRVIESGVRRCPAQYFWIHRRFKSTNAALPDVYTPTVGSP
ncbi:MAG: LpxL/LpxP family Kdo(2)-lipid IV(A) lauroyl/palmitoleoyl acyltransferase [Nevskiales bacterium]|nr:LpxL/LpxP family Kdo(2)-lipid IV(A) lauroyl/palmitoleoyl acyltransferase [Nevskiales bacterium]